MDSKAEFENWAQDEAAEGLIDDVEMVAREMFPEDYAAIDDDHPMSQDKVRAVFQEVERRKRISKDFLGDTKNWKPTGLQQPSPVARCRVCYVARRSHDGGDHPFTEHEEWCGDPALSRPVDQCTCDVTPAEQARQNRTGTQVQRWADEAMFTAVPIGEEGQPVTPRVTLVSMTPDPLRVIAAVNEMYKGNPVGRPADIPQDQAVDAFRGIAKTTLQAPFEFVDLHFLIEGVSRAWTHQAVRQRTAVFAQESLRFAVKEDFPMIVPPSIAALDKDDPQRFVWDSAAFKLAESYNALVESGIPAEDARSLLPTNIATRLHYKTNLRNLKEHAGMRLCSQAQNEWKQVWREMVAAIMCYGPQSESWQQREITRLFKPVCYNTGKCEFNGPSDRWCVIRDRVEAHHKKGDTPETWTDINPLEPLHHESARRFK